MAARSEHHPFKSAEARERYLAFYDERAARWPVPSRTRAVHTDQGETFVRISGPEGAQPLVLLNGIFSASVMSPPAMITTFAERYRLYTMDRPWDIGRSANATDRAGRDEHVAWIGAVLDALGLQRTYLMGISLGAWAATEYALVRPERVAKLVWMSPSGIVGSAYTGAVIWNMRLALRAMRSPSPQNVRAMLEDVMPDSIPADSEAGREFAEYVDSVALGMECFAKRPVARETNRRLSDAELRTLPMPVLYLAGERELFSLPAKNVARLARVAPEIRTVVIPDCGHDLITLKPGEAARHIAEFLDAGGQDGRLAGLEERRGEAR